jgi:hypothetical protein
LNWEFIMGTALNDLRVNCYHKLALVEANKAVAALLNRLAREAERGALASANQISRVTGEPHNTH